MLLSTSISRADWGAQGLCHNDSLGPVVAIPIWIHSGVELYNIYILYTLKLTRQADWPLATSQLQEITVPLIPRLSWAATARTASFSSLNTKWQWHASWQNEGAWRPYLLRPYLLRLRVYMRKGVLCFTQTKRTGHDTAADWWCVGSPTRVHCGACNGSGVTG